MENKQVEPEGLAVGPEEAEVNNSPVGDGLSEEPETQEQAFARVLEEHHWAIQGLSLELMEHRGLLEYLGNMLEQLNGRT